MEPNKHCLFFAGGKKISIDSTSSQSVIKLSKNANGVLVVELKFTFSTEEALKSVFNFPELQVEEAEIAATKPNMVYVEAYNENAEPKEIAISAGNFIMAYDKGVYSEFILKGVIASSGKTDHAKTDHPQTAPPVSPTPEPPADHGDEK